MNTTNTNRAARARALNSAIYSKCSSAVAQAAAPNADGSVPLSSYAPTLADPAIAASRTTAVKAAIDFNRFAGVRQCGGISDTLIDSIEDEFGYDDEGSMPFRVELDITPDAL